MGKVYVGRNGKENLNKKTVQTIFYTLATYGKKLKEDIGEKTNL